MAKRYSAEQWAAWVEEQRESALSVRDFCDWIGVSQNAFYLWRRKLAANARNGRSLSNSCEPTSTSQAQRADVRSLFVPLTVVSNPMIEVDLPCGAVVRVPHEESSLRRVLSILLEAGSAMLPDSGGETRT